MRESRATAVDSCGCGHQRVSNTTDGRSAKGGKYLREEGRTGRWAYACGPKGKVRCAGEARGREEEEEFEKQLPSGKTRNRNQAAGRPVQGAGAPTIHPPFFFLP